MHADRLERLRAAMAGAGLDALLLLGTTNVSYATGAVAPGTDASRALIARPVAVVEADGGPAHLFTPYPDGAPAGLAAGHLHPAVFPDLEEGAAALAGQLAEHLPPGARLGCDELTHPLRSHLGDWEVVPARARGRRGQAVQDGRRAGSASAGRRPSTRRPCATWPPSSDRACANRT